MPTISFSLKDLQSLVGKKLTLKDLEQIAEYCKGECENYNKATDEVTFSLDDTNLPYLWSVEGIALLVRGAYGLEKGIPELKISKGKYEINVDQNVSPIRPFIASFVAKGKKIDQYLLKQLIQLQEKFCESYGRKRKKASIGMYSYKRIKFPVIYKAVLPSSVSFIPLEFDRKLNLSQILEQHPKGKDYAYILKDKKQYPVLVDSNNEVLSFIPVINSNFTGRLEVGDSELMFEVTGEDEDTINLAANIFAQALYVRGFDIFSVKINYPDRKVSTPFLFNDKIKLNEADIQKLLGLDLKKAEIKEILQKARYDFSEFIVKIPPYRKDIMHPYDVIEDIAIMYGFHNIKDSPLSSFTVGQPLPMAKYADMFREMLIGMQYQEIMSQILTNKSVLFDRMNVKEYNAVEIKNYMSETYSIVRSSLIPLMLEVLSKNKHVEYPQKIFEEGVVTIKGKNIVDHQVIAAVSSHKDANYTEIRQVVDYIFRVLDVKFTIEDAVHPSFLSGRTAKIIVNGKEVGLFGEINPVVLEHWNLEMPVCALELNISLLFDQSLSA